MAEIKYTSTRIVDGKPRKGINFAVIIGSTVRQAINADI
jgi:hypothetical protein